MAARHRTDCLPLPPSSPTPLASISAISPVSPPIHPHPSSASRVLPGSVRNCSWRSRGTPKPANGKRRDAEIGTVDGKVGEKESGGAGLSVKVAWGSRGSARERASGRDPRLCSRGTWGLECAKILPLVHFPFNENPQISVKVTQRLTA